jgi:hypothetical protein
MTYDHRIDYWGPTGFIAAPDEEFSISVAMMPENPGEEGWSAHLRWAMDSECGVLLDAPEFFHSYLIDDWLVPLTGYTRDEFVDAFKLWR